MQVRIRLTIGPQIVTQRKLEAKLALAFSSLLTPAAFLCVVVALWGVLADTNVATKFVIEEGLLSHWQVWLASGGLVQAFAIFLERYGKRQGE